MTKKIVKIDGKSYVVDSDTSKMEEVEIEEEEVKEEKEEEKEEKEDFDESIDGLAEKISSQLGLDKIIEAADVIKNAAKGKEDTDKKGTVLNLEKIMNTDLSEMTTSEKVVGFFQALFLKDTVALKALSEGVAQDGGYLFPKFIGELKLDELLENPFKRTISSQALPVMV